MPQPNVQCAFCGELIYRSPAQITKSKTGQFFCKREHRRSWKFLRLKTYRKIAFDNNPHKCDECGWDKFIEVLEVHHINFDHNDDRLYNLRILCPTCHRIEHWEARQEATMDAAWTPDWDEPELDEI